VLIAALGASACGGSNGSTATAPTSACPTGERQCAPETGGSPSAKVPGEPALLVLADGIEGGTGLWSLDASGQWKSLEAIADGRAIARDGNVITIAHAASLETRSVSEPETAGTTVPLTWTSAKPSAPIVAVDRSIMGSTAIAAAEGQSMTYGIASPEGTVIPLQGAPDDSLTPLVTWLDAHQILVLTNGKEQVSRIVALNVSKRTGVTIQKLTGVRWFAVSADLKTIAAATESGIFTGPVAYWLSGGEPAQSIALDASQVVWALALNQDGTQLAMLSGTVASDGSVSNVSELGYEKVGSTWTRTFNKPVPFTQCLGQVWVD
jgi:hypothetical protein